MSIEGLDECPRCGTQAQHATKDHLDRCGEASDGFPAGRWRARAYLGLSKAEQDAMRAIEVADVLGTKREVAR